MSVAETRPDRRKVALGAASLRVVLGIAAVLVLPWFYPKTSELRAVYLMYLLLAAASLPFVWKQIGGRVRVITSGVVDLAMLTFIVHRVGSLFTTLVALYLFLCMLNTIIVGRREGMTLAIIASLMYTSVIVAERSGWLPYAPDAPPGLMGRPPPNFAPAAAALVSTVSLVATWIVGILVERIRTRELELEEANRQLAVLSQHDPLTHLYNRRHLVARIEAELARVRRGHAMALLMIDLDGFKRVNDERGHLVGDELLKAIADGLAAATRETDVAGRYGGDEFLVVLPDADAQRAQSAAERLCSKIRDVGAAFAVSASVGVAIARNGDELREILARADEAAYRAKQAGGDRVVMVE
jgi:diguanylate cyclase (GGDEF)-like protein